MFSELDNDTIAYVVKSNPEVETIIQSIIDDNKRTTSMFVHELRNPLSLLKSTIQYIETKHPETREFKYWDQMQDLVHDLEHMMADASQLNTYNGLNKEESDFIALILGISNSFMPQASQQKIDFTLNIHPDCEALLSSYYCDIIKMKQAISNLIKNAFEAVAPGNYINVELAAVALEEQIPTKFYIKIKNNGAVIPEDKLENIFTPFVTYKKGGTGVGLAIVKKIVNLHFGSIGVTSDEAETCFTIILPL